jgi:enoyl-CoA hydratase/carnithine racemase
MALSPERPQSTLDPAGQTVGDYLKSWWDNDTKTVDKLMHIWHIGTPVIAAVNGWTMGGGFWYAMACDITIASDQAVFAQPEVRHISNTTFLFAALAGWKAAHRYALTGDHMDAQEALRLGIVNEVVSPDQLLSTARALAERIAQVPEPSVRLNKAITCYGLEAAGLRSGMLLNGALSALAHTSHQPVRDDLFAAMREGGMRAFLDKRDTPFRPEPFGPRSTGR